MRWLNCTLIVVVAFGLASCGDVIPMAGGPCDYQAWPGLCTVQEDGTFTFVGEVYGREYTLPENTFDESTRGSYGVGDEFVCSLSMITSGTCTPCLFTSGAEGDAYFGAASSAAWDVCNGDM